jgi:exodeoxyribonuclease VII large subunit
VRDIINVTGRRYPLAKVYLYPALVQGAGAEADLVSAVDYFDKSGLCDVIIIGRGGGSIEDLWAFNSEALARKIFECRIPIISAVGHETDFTICDFVSDMRAPTPSAAAELAVPDSSEIRIALDGILDRCSSALVRNVERARERLDRAGASFTAEKFSLLVGEKREELSRVYERAVTAIDGRLEQSRGDLAILTEKLSALSPLSVLSRGYSVVTRKGCGIGTVSDLEIGDRISVRFRDGSVTADVTEINEV